MKFHRENDVTNATISSYRDTEVVVGGRSYPLPVCVFSTCGPVVWPYQEGGYVSEDNFSFLMEYDLEVLLWGTGNNIVVEYFGILPKLAGGGLPVEIMTTPAACRTFNVLCLEKRRVGAVIFSLI
ncbi:Mth938-like domain-containing protein [Candidatus Ichthyocystis hellenicum]|uniref:Mth938-like domain-containing protein n=1 Tax=Candidatus Ichthyocystis hellenicum TaxID=1561003 RepID=UPI000B86A1A3|nr:Mth938-like domain-containing protein [Candidatus Ichthyocystis hellenicum]